jgi:hypothetical protein
MGSMLARIITPVLLQPLNFFTLKLHIFNMMCVNRVYIKFDVFYKYMFSTNKSISKNVATLSVT